MTKEEWEEMWKNTPIMAIKPDSDGVEDDLPWDKHDAVEHSVHYTNTSIECIDAMTETQGDIAVINFCVCNAFKYLWRHNSKNGFEDIRKAAWYLNKAVSLYDSEKEEQ